VVKLCQTLDATPGVSRVLASQLLRSDTSVGANVEEAQASQSKADFISKYSIACKEARETRYWLRLITASEIIPKNRLKELTAECDQIIAILTSIILKMRKQNQ
jgi:four helix bundle protein